VKICVGNSVSVIKVRNCWAFFLKTIQFYCCQRYENTIKALLTIADSGLSCFFLVYLCYFKDVIQNFAKIFLFCFSVIDNIFNQIIKFHLL
jgi:hypothetical protein